MTVSRYKISLNNARFPLVSTWGQRAVLVPSMDTAGRAVKAYVGSEESTDYNLPQILYGENFVPVANGVKSVSYVENVGLGHTTPIAQTTDFDQVFALRDSEENAVLLSPSKGRNFILEGGEWVADTITQILDSFTYELVISTDSTNTPETAKVTRAYVDGKTFVCYSRMLAVSNTTPGDPGTFDASLYYWDPVLKVLRLMKEGFPGDQYIVGLPFAETFGQIDGISSSNGYLLIWSGLTVYWAPFNGTAFDFSLYANGDITGAGSQIPEDVQGPITAIVPMSGGFIIFTTKNAVAAFYNANNFASPWIFRNISNAGGVESFEQVASEGNLGSAYAYTTGGLQRISLNAAEPVFPDVADFLGGRLIESFNTGDLTFEEGQVSTEFFVKLTYCGQRFLVISYGTYPGVFSFALVYDASLQRWGKLRVVHRDCFHYSYGTEEVDLTYAMLGDVSYDDMGETTYEGATIPGSPIVYPRQSIAFLQKGGAIRLAALDYRSPEDESEAFIVVGKNQLTRARLACLHEVEVEGLQPGGTVAVWRSVNGKTLEAAQLGVIREQVQDWAEVGFDEVTGKNFTVYVKGDFALSDLILSASTDGSF